MKFLLLGFLLMSLLISCSGSKSTQDVGDKSAGLELSEADDLLSDDDFASTDETADLFAADTTVEEPAAEATEPASEQPVFEEQFAETEPAVEEPMMENPTEMNTEMVEPREQFAEADNSKPVIDDLGSERSYRVSKNETLMLVAFKIYGDYLKWRDLLQANNDLLKGNPSNLKPGMNLRYYHSGENFVWNPGGNPYLIKNNDTLGTISKDVYGTYKKWKDIWHHNEPLIKDPNKIYVGFTIYYLEQDGRGVASP